MSFSSTRCATEGFRLIRREPAMLAAWCLAYVAINVAGLLLVRPFYTQLLARLAEGPGSPGRGLDMLQAYAVFIPLTLLPVAVFSCAVYRAVLDPRADRAARLRLGPDEARIAVLWLLLGLLFAGVWIGALVLAGTIMGLLGAMRPFGYALASLLAVAAVSLGLVALTVRLSLAGPMTLADRRLRLLASWRLTRGLFWKMLGCNALAAVFGTLLWVASTVVQAAILTWSGEPLDLVLRSWWQAEAQLYMRPLSWETFASAGASSVFAALWFAVMFAPGAAAYRALAAGTPRSEAEVFD